MAKRQKTIFFIRVVRIKIRNRVWVAKYCGRLFKGYTVTGQVSSCFSRVPLKLHRSSKYSFESLKKALLG